jgi:hypothetical protein
MALIYSPSLSALFMQGLIMPYGSGNNNQFSVVFMSGPQPTAAELAANWSTTYKYPSNCLAVAQLSINWTQTDTLVSITNPQTLNAFGTGTAAWAVWFSNNNWLTSASLSGSLPIASFMILPVSISTGNGVIRLNTVDLVSGQPFTIVDGGFTARMV